LLYTVEKGIYEETPKTGKTRLIKLPKETMDIIKAVSSLVQEQRLLMGIVGKLTRSGKAVTLYLSRKQANQCTPIA
jgi:hypothetical protein